jgi:hypothetical protein
MPGDPRPAFVGGCLFFTNYQKRGQQCQQYWHAYYCCWGKKKPFNLLYMLVNLSR